MKRACSPDPRPATTLARAARGFDPRPARAVARRRRCAPTCSRTSPSRVDGHATHRRPLRADRLRHRHRDARRPARRCRGGDGRRRDDAGRALRADHPRPEQARTARGARASPHDPLVVIVSGRLDLPWDAGAVHRRRRAGADLHRLRRGAARDRHAGRGRPPRGRRRPGRGDAPPAHRARHPQRCSARAARTCTRDLLARRARRRALRHLRRRGSAGGGGPRIDRAACGRRADRPRARLAAARRTSELFARYRVSADADGPSGRRWPGHGGAGCHAPAASDLAAPRRGAACAGRGSSRRGSTRSPS